MAYEMEMRDDGILRLAFAGDIDMEEMEAFRQEFEVFLEAATEQDPVRIISDSSQPTKFSSAARRVFIDQQASPKVGKVAAVGATRYIRVLVSLILKATGRDDVRFFDAEEEALAWLRAES